MDVASGLVLFAVVWFMVLFVVLPLRLTTQGEAGKVVPGTPPGAPHGVNLKRKLAITTLVAVLVWGLITAVIISGVIDLSEIQFFNRPSGPAPDQT